MNKLEKIKEIGFKITWKFLKLGYFGNKYIQAQITKQDLSEYAYSLLEKMEFNYNEIAQLTNIKLEDYEIDQILDKLIKFDDSDMELQYQKWIIFLTKEMIENLNSNYFENLLTITEFWVSLGQPKNSPHIFQAVGNQITPQEYYTEEMYNLILCRHKEWINQEIRKIIQLEKINNMERKGVEGIVREKVMIEINDCRYKSINELDKFSLHDAIIEEIKIEDNEMIWKVKNANVTIDNSQNNDKYDLCADIIMKFEKIDITKFVWLGSEVWDENGNLLEKIEDRNIEPKNALNELEKFLNPDSWINYHEKVKGDAIYIFTIAIEDRIFEFTMKFEKFTAAWNEYKGKAWYV